MQSRWLPLSRPDTVAADRTRHPANAHHEGAASTLGAALRAFACGAAFAAAVLMAAMALAMPPADSAAGDRLAAVDSRVAVADAPRKLGYRPQRGMFLVAGPRMPDPRFARTVILLLEYDESGALGLVVNRPTEVSLHDALVTPLPGSANHRIHAGGPVEHRRLIALHRSHEAVGDAQHVFGDVYASGSFDALRRMLERDGHAADLRAYLGYAGWGPGQLDSELARDDWIVTPADAESIFDASPDEVWEDLIRRNAGRWVRHGSAVRSA